MTAADSTIVTEDHRYPSGTDAPLTLTLRRPRESALVPVVVDLHGGAWNNGGRGECADRDTVLARHGIAAAAIDFRHAGDGYPTSLQDINVAIRWLKANAGRLGLDPARVGLCGQSSGGHLAMLAAMRPGDPRYAALALPAGVPEVDAAVRCVAMTWPVINPLSRYRHALRARASANPPGWVGDIPERHDTYWGTEDAMAEGNPMLALERGEPVCTPPALWVQGRPDPVHDYNDPEAAFEGNEPDRFVQSYRRAGGMIDLVAVEQATRSNDATHALVAAFCAKHLLDAAGGAGRASAAD